jgi:hypothetical protein
MSDITVINDTQQSQLVTNGLAKNGELYLKAEGSTNAGAVVVYDSGAWKTFANEAVSGFPNTYSVNFDGSNDYVACGSISALNSATNFSLSMWVNFQSFVGNLAGYNIFLGSGTTTSDRFLLNVVRGSATSADRLEVYFCEGAASIVGTSLGLTANTWYHMALYKSGSNMSFYIDNTLIDSRTNAPTSGSATGSNFAIGRGIYGGAYSANILADEVALWNSDQSSNKDSIYNNGTPGDLSSLSPTSWWRMGDNDGGTGTTITDQGSGGNNGTLTNGPTFSTNVPS